MMLVLEGCEKASGVPRSISLKSSTALSNGYNRGAAKAFFQETYLSRPDNKGSSQRMATKLFVGSLPWAVDDQALADLFKEFGTVASAKVIMDRETGRSKGFGFVEFDDDEAAKAAINKLNGTDLQGRTIVVSEARPLEPRPPRHDFDRR